MSSADLTVLFKDFLSIINAVLQEVFSLMTIEKWPDVFERELCIVFFSRTWAFGRGVPVVSVMVPVNIVFCANGEFVENSKMAMVTRSSRHGEPCPCNKMPDNGGFIFICFVHFKPFNRCFLIRWLR